MIKNGILTTALIALLAAPLVAQNVDQEFGDRLTVVDDKGEIKHVDNIKITSATYEKIVYDTRGRENNERSANEVVRIGWGDTPRVYGEGEAALQKDQFEAAASDFEGAKNAVAAGKARDWVLEYASVNRGTALLGLAAANPASRTDAIAEFQKALELNPKSFLFDEIQLGLAKAYLLDGKWDQAKAAAQSLADVGTQTKQPVWLCSGQKALAEVLVAQGKYADAGNAWQDLVLSAQRELKYAKNAQVQKKLTALETAGAVEQGWAKISRAESTGASSDWDEAKRYFETLGARYPDNESVSAAILNGVGRALMETDPRAAVMKFAEAEVVHFTARGEVARALYLKAKAYEKMAETEKTGSTRYRTMAEEARKELREFYPDSIWAKQ